MKLLMIGGARFSGRALTELALERGHEVTLFHRTPTELFPEAEHVIGDREEGVDALAGRTFDAVVDTCGYVPRAVRASTETARRRAAGTASSPRSRRIPRTCRPGANEDSPIFEPPFPDTEEVTDETYGPLKVACERQVQAVFGDRACVIRPGLHRRPPRPHRPVHLLGAPGRRRRRDDRAGARRLRAAVGRCPGPGGVRAAARRSLDARRVRCGRPRAHDDAWAS